MQIGDRQFPYPTLSKPETLLNSFEKGYFSFAYDAFDADVETKTFVIKNARYETNSPFLKGLIEKGKAAVILIVECSAAVFRPHYELKEEGRDIFIPLSNLSGRVEFSAIAYAKEDIRDYQDEDFLDEYRGLSFELDKGNFIAVDDRYSCKVEHPDKADNYVSSIVTVIKKGDEEEEHTIETELTGHKIIIKLPKDSYEKYDESKRNPTLGSIYFGIMLVPAITSVLVRLKDEAVENSREDMEDFPYEWMYSFCEAYKKGCGTELTVEELKKLDPFVAAQKIVGFQSAISINNIYDFAYSRQPAMDGEEED